MFRVCYVCVWSGRCLFIKYLCTRTLSKETVCKLLHGQMERNEEVRCPIVIFGVCIYRFGFCIYKQNIDKENATLALVSLRMQLRISVTDSFVVASRFYMYELKRYK